MRDNIRLIPVAHPIPTDTNLHQDRRAPPSATEARSPGSHTPPGVLPEIADGDEVGTCVHQRQRVAHPRQYAKGLTQMLQALRPAVAVHLKCFAAAAPSNHERVRQSSGIQAALLRRPLQNPEFAAQIEV
jgi:hypothetical protein